MPFTQEILSRFCLSFFILIRARAQSVGIDDDDDDDDDDEHEHEHEHARIGLPAEGHDAWAGGGGTLTGRGGS